MVLTDASGVCVVCCNSWTASWPTTSSRGASTRVNRLSPLPPRALTRTGSHSDGSQTLGSRCRGQSATREHARPEESWQLCAGSRGQGTDRRWLLAWQLLASQLSCLRGSTRSSNLATSTLATSPTSLTTPPPARMFVPRPSLHPPPRRCDPPPQVLVPRRRGGKVP